MNTSSIRKLVLLCLAALILSCARPPDLPELDESAAAWVGEQIFRNECNADPDCLTSWNAGEDFPSLGIGHFIWFRAGQEEPFQESFPRLLEYYASQGVETPVWIRALPDDSSPWQAREEFLAEQDTPRMRELREFFLDTRDVQARFIIRRLHEGVPAIIAASEQPDRVEALFYRLAEEHPRHGMYALIDYVNFKGEGINPAERYQGEGWGLLQVLEQMLDMSEDEPLMQRFADAAWMVLERRVENAPPERGEGRWLQGWYNRTRTYIPDPGLS